MATAISILIHDDALYTYVPCVSWETMMNIYNTNMHQFMMQCGSQKIIKQNTKFFNPASQNGTNDTNDFLTDKVSKYCYKKQKVLNQLKENNTAIKPYLDVTVTLKQPSNNNISY